MQTADILRAAAGHVRQGWTRGNYYDGDKVCVVGAISRAVGVDLSLDNPYVAGTRQLWKARRAVNDYLCRDDGLTLNAVAWNDDVAEDAEDAASMLEKAAAWVEERQS